MISLVLDGHDMAYEAGNLCYLFFPGEKLKLQPAGAIPGGDAVVTRLKRCARRTWVFVTIVRGGRRRRAAAFCLNDLPDYEKQCEFALGRAFYTAASRLNGFFPPWGILTGIRPAKIARALLAQGMTPRRAQEALTQEYWVAPRKAALCVSTALAEEGITRLSRPESVSLYISVPFCPTRCLYCSFISQDVRRMERLLPEYTRLLCREIAETGRLVKALGLRLETIYMGGGTPTSLSADALSRVFEMVAGSFTLDTLREYTVEAGRPDTITAEKLRAMRRGGVGRVCINPQTLDDDILRAIGRSHTAEQFFSAFLLARREGIPSINTDLIAGLPGDSPEGFARTLEGVLRLKPEGVTIHSLAMKRSSRLVTGGSAPYDPRGGDASAMLDYAYARLAESGYLPYYLYRQRNTTGNLENVGYALPGHEGLYNIFIMDETHTVLSVGAGGVTKLRSPHSGRIERIFNFKYPDEYISRFDEILERKRRVIKFYGDHP